MQYNNYDIGVSFFPAAVLRGIPYQNNSNVTLEDIGEGDDALLCITNLTACCQPPYTGEMGHTLGNWFFPNRTSIRNASLGSDIFRTRGQMVVCMHRRRGGEEGIYRCEIPDAMNVTQTIYISVYSASTGEWYMYVYVLLHNHTGILGLHDTYFAGDYHACYYTIYEVQHIERHRFVRTLYLDDK